MDIVTIDGETARDFDDAVWVDRLPNGNFALHVHIADVSHYVRPGTPIDVEARLRGTSVYFPDRAVPMLPFELSTDICSLNPQVDRLVLSALLEFDHQGDLVAQEFMRGVIRSAERMTYTNVHLLLEGDKALRERYAPLVQRFEWMQELATDSEPQAPSPRIARFRSPRAAHRIRRMGRDDRRLALAAKYRPSPHRRVHAGRQ